MTNLPAAPRLSRRTLLQGAAAGAALAVLAPAPPSWAGAAERRLAIAPGRSRIVGADRPETAVWAYEGSVPGPEIRVRRGERLRVLVENRLPQPTTVHWHGIRLPHAMDGVPNLTQPPIPPGGSFVYDFEVPDAGTFWYHPHAASHIQKARGLAGALIVEEPEAPAVDRDVVWLIDDWRLDRGAQLVEDFGSSHDVSHEGRLGNTVTINGTVPDTFAVKPGERLRLRLINAANARVLGLTFEGHQPTVLALDGHPVAPHALPAGRLVLAPGQRADVVLDAVGEPGKRYRVVDGFYGRQSYRLVDLAYAEGGSRAQPRPAPGRLPANPLPEPDLAAASRHEIVFDGGMKHGIGSMMRSMFGAHGHGPDGRVWTLNGAAALEHEHGEAPPLLTLRRGESVILALRNESEVLHPMHLHGHAFRLLSRNGAPTAHREWLDTVLIAPKERVEIAFLADNPGDWMFHCHILEHQLGGMMGTVRVA